MYMYLSENVVMMAIFILGMVIGAVVYRIITEPLNNQDRRDLQAMRLALDAFERRNRPPPPKPEHNPNK